MRFYFRINKKNTLLASTLALLIYFFDWFGKSKLKMTWNVRLMQFFVLCSAPFAASLYFDCVFIAMNSPVGSFTDSNAHSKEQSVWLTLKVCAITFSLLRLPQGHHAPHGSVMSCAPWPNPKASHDHQGWFKPTNSWHRPPPSIQRLPLSRHTCLANFPAYTH